MEVTAAPAQIRCVYHTQSIFGIRHKLMRKTIFFLLFSIFSLQVFAQKEAQEFPWSRAAKIIESDEAKTSPQKKPDRRPDTPSTSRAPHHPEADDKKPDKKMDGDSTRRKQEPMP